MNDPKTYDEKDAFVQETTRNVVNEFRDEVKAMRGKILDIGCGPGTTTKNVLLPKLSDDTVIVSIDKSPEMLKYAEENNSDEKRISFFELDIELERVPLNLIGNYDHAVAFFLLHWCRNIEVVLNNIYKLLRPGGTALSISFSHCTAIELHLKFEKNPKYSIYMQNAAHCVASHYGLPNPQEALRKDLQGAGFEVLHCTNRWRTYAFENLDIFLDLLMSVSTFLNKMPKDLQQEYRNDVAKEVKEILSVNSNEGPAVERYAIMVAYFKKPMKK